MQRLTRDQELEQMRRLFGDEPAGLHAVLERQFNVLMARAQVLLGLCGVVVTTTGFSGRIIAGTNTLAQYLIVIGISLTMAAAAVVVFGVLPLRWLTQQPGDGIDGWMREALVYRDRKLNAYRIGIVLLLVGLTLYVGAIAIMLLHPEANAVQFNR